jgi:hypothetical protein
MTDLNTFGREVRRCHPNLNPDGDDQEENNTTLLWLQNQVETGEPSEKIVRQCLAYFAEFESRTASG